MLKQSSEVASGVTCDSSGSPQCSGSGKTVYSTIQRFEELTEKRTIETAPFLIACTDIAAILDRLGTGFSLPKKDMLGNIKRIEDHYKTNPERYSTLNAIVEEDVQNGGESKKTHIFIGLLWLKRGLEFLQAFISVLSDEYHKDNHEQNLRPTVLKAYGDTLKKYHGKMTQFVVSNVARLVPYRMDFLSALILKEGGTIEMVIMDIDLYLPSFSDNIKLVEELINMYGLNTEKEIS